MIKVGIFCDMVSNLKLGQWIETDGDGDKSCELFQGEVGFFSPTLIYIFQDEFDGRQSSLPPENRGYRYSWQIEKNNHRATLRILKDVPNIRLNMIVKYIELYDRNYRFGIIQDIKKDLVYLKDLTTQKQRSIYKTDILTLANDIIQ